MVLLILWNLDMLNSHFKTGFLYAFYICRSRWLHRKTNCAFTLSCFVHVAVAVIIKCFVIVEPIIAIKSHLYLISSVSCISLSCWALLSLSLSIYHRKKIKYNQKKGKPKVLYPCRFWLLYNIVRNLIKRHITFIWNKSWPIGCLAAIWIWISVRFDSSR